MDMAGIDSGAEMCCDPSNTCMHALAGERVLYRTPSRTDNANPSQDAWSRCTRHLAGEIRPSQNQSIVADGRRRAPRILCNATLK